MPYVGGIFYKFDKFCDDVVNRLIGDKKITTQAQAESQIYGEVQKYILFRIEEVFSIIEDDKLRNIRINEAIDSNQVKELIKSQTEIMLRLYSTSKNLKETTNAILSTQKLYDQMVNDAYYHYFKTKQALSEEKLLDVSMFTYYESIGMENISENIIADHIEVIDHLIEADHLYTEQLEVFKVKVTNESISEETRDVIQSCITLLNEIIAINNFSKNIRIAAFGSRLDIVRQKVKDGDIYTSNTFEKKNSQLEELIKQWDNIEHSEEGIYKISNFIEIYSKRITNLVKHDYADEKDKACFQHTFDLLDILKVKIEEAKINKSK